MNFKKYQHIERLDTDEVDGILNGTVYVFSKLDGTNTGVFKNNNGEICVNSRNRQLSIEDDNRGVYKYILSQDKFKNYLDKHPNHYLYGEWLVKHHIKDYKVNAWNKLYIFDIIEYNEDGTHRYLSYEEYVPLLEEFNIEYIPLLDKSENPTKEYIQSLVDKCTFLMKDDCIGEGIVIKNVNYLNKRGRHIWAKIVRSEFITQKSKPSTDTISVETKIIENLFTEAFIEKEYLKFIEEIGDWNSKWISRFLGTIWHTFITEECWNIMKKYKEPTINFKLLHKLINAKIKEIKVELF